MNFDFRTGVACIEGYELRHNLPIDSFLHSQLGLRATIVAKHVSDSRYLVTSPYDDGKMTAWVDLTFRGSRLVRIAFEFWPTEGDQALSRETVQSLRWRLEAFFGFSGVQTFSWGTAGIHQHPHIGLWYGFVSYEE